MLIFLTVSDLQWVAVYLAFGPFSDRIIPDPESRKIRILHQQPVAPVSCVKKSASLSLKDTQKDNFQSVIFAVIVKAKLDHPLKKALLLPWYHMKWALATTRGKWSPGFWLGKSVRKDDRVERSTN